MNGIRTDNYVEQHQMIRKAYTSTNSFKEQIQFMKLDHWKLLQILFHIRTCDDNCGKNLGKICVHGNLAEL